MGIKKYILQLCQMKQRQTTTIRRVNIYPPTHQRSGVLWKDRGAKVRLVQPQKTFGEVKERASRINFSQESKAEIHISKHCERSLESEGGC